MQEHEKKLVLFIKCNIAGAMERVEVLRGWSAGALGASRSNLNGQRFDTCRCRIVMNSMLTNNQNKKRIWMMYNKKWELHVKACWEAWHNRCGGLGFLEDLPTYHTYLAIISMATSVKHLERLHEMLPDNVRLLREDWVKLREFWQCYFVGKNADACREQLVEWVLFEQSTSWRDAPKLFPSEVTVGDADAWLFQRAAEQWSTMTKYYASYVRNHGLSQPPIHFSGGESGSGDFTPTFRILSSIERSGHGDEHFMARLFGMEMEVCFLLSKNRKHLLARFVVREKELSEELTHNILSQLPLYYVYKYGVSMGSARDTYINIAFEFEAGELMEHLKKKGDDMLATQTFSSAVFELLRTKGIPIQTLSSIDGEEES